MKAYISRGQCKDGYFYEITSRNLILGVYNAETKSFIGIREKLGATYLDVEEHCENNNCFSTVKPKKEICECPVHPISIKNEQLFDWIEKETAKYFKNKEKENGSR